MHIQDGLSTLIASMPTTASVEAVADAVLAYHRRTYLAHTPAATLVEFQHGPGAYLFDHGSDARSERTVAVAARPAPPDGPRDVTYQRGFPSRAHRQGRALDRGHFVAFSGGGLFGPNVFDQDRALNRGWSRAGRRYRALENWAVRTRGAVLVVLAHYADDTDFPVFLEVIAIDPSGLDAERFRNRFDLPLDENESLLDAHLDAATNAQIGRLGEETAAAWIESEHDGTIVALGDSEMPRTLGRQDLDALAIIDGALVAFEVKTRFHSQYAGRITRTGDLHRPRLRRTKGPGGHRQGSQRYVADRLADHVDTDDEDYEGVEVQVIAVDLVSFLIQQYEVDDAGRKLRPLTPPRYCRRDAEVALNRILEHRGHL